jgi:hypothetical protein
MKKVYTYILIVSIGILAFYWRIPWLLSERIASDEWPSIYTAIKIYDNCKMPIFLVGQNYMAPFKEALAFPMIFLFGKDIFYLRIASSILFIMSAILGFIILKKIIGVKLSFAIIICYIFPFTTVNQYDSSLIGQYSSIMLLILLMIYFIDRWVQKKDHSALIIFSIISGISYYVFSISIFQYLSGLLWAIICSSKWDIFKANIKNRFAYILVLYFVCFIISLLLLYRPLTQSQQILYNPSQYFIFGLLIVFALGSLFASVYAFGLSRSDLKTIGFAAIPFVFFAALPALIFKLLVYPELVSKYEISLYSIGYSLKHAHEWPHQILNFFTGAFPALIFGRGLGDIRGAAEFSQDFTLLKILLGFYFVFCILMFLIKNNIFNRKLNSRSPLWLFVFPTLVNLIVLLPSWRLFGDYSYRYMIPYYLGILIILFAPFLFLKTRYQFLAILCALTYASFSFLEQKRYFNNISNDKSYSKNTIIEPICLKADLIIAPWNEVFELWFNDMNNQKFEIAEKSSRGFFAPENRRDFDIIAVSKTISKENWPQWVLDRGSFRLISQNINDWDFYQLEKDQ